MIKKRVADMIKKDLFIDSEMIKKGRQRAVLYTALPEMVLQSHAIHRRGRGDFVPYLRLHEWFGREIYIIDYRFRYRFHFRPGK